MLLLLTLVFSLPLSFLLTESLWSWGLRWCIASLATALPRASVRFDGGITTSAVPIWVVIRASSVVPVSIALLFQVATSVATMVASVEDSLAVSLPPTIRHTSLRAFAFTARVVSVVSLVAAPISTIVVVSEEGISGGASTLC